MSDLPGYINLEVGEDVTDENLQPLLRGLLAMHDYLMSLGVGEPKRVYTLNVHRNRNNLIGFLEETLRNAERQIEDRAGEIRWMVEELNYNGYIYSNDAPLGARLVVFLGASRYSGYERDALMSSGAEMLRRTVVPVWHGNHPAWMRYGGAELHDTLSLSEAGLISDESARRERRRYVNDANAIQNFLGNLETQRGFESRNVAGAYAFLASELLASRAGPDALLRFFENLQLGTSWKTIFQKVFGMSVDEFYVLFDTHHRAGFPLVSVPVPGSTPDVKPRYSITTSPAAYYKQFIDVEGIIVKANDQVEVASMYNAADVIKVMMSSLRDDIKRCLIRQDAAMAIAPFDAALTTLPEFYPQKGRSDWEAGLGAVKGQPVSGSDETGIMTGRYSVVLHEFAHAIDGLCFTRNDLNELVSIYENARRAELLSGTYANSNYGEFFAEFSVRYFEPWDESAWNGAYGRLPSRQQLGASLPEMFAFLGEIYKGFEREPDEPSITPPTPTPQPTATPIAFEATTPDQEALVALYNATDGPNWTRDANWLSDRPLHTWAGVRMDDGRVTGLHLGDGGLRGKLPPELGNLTQLREFWLGGDNDLEGEIPDELSQLNRLEVLDFGSVGLNGAIPAWLGDFIHLWYLHLDDNNFVGEVPAELGNLTRLRSFTLNGNSGLTGPLPESLASISGLERFEYHATGLCAPFESRFQNWLQGISDLYESGNICPSDSDTPDVGGGQAIVRDIFGRVVNETGIVLVDWEGHIYNPVMKYTVELPVRSATLSGNDSRLHFDLPSETGANGPSKRLISEGSPPRAEFSITIFPDRDSLDETHALTIRYLDIQNRPRTQIIDVHVIDQDLDRPSEFEIISDFQHDETGFFDDPATREAVRQAADDLAYFIADMDLDEVRAGDESIWVNEPGDTTTPRDWGVGKWVSNRVAYTGFLLGVYGNYRIEGGPGGSGGTSPSGRNQSARGKEFPIKRSGVVDMNPKGNWGSDGWQTSVDDSLWWAAWHHGKDDLYSIVLHEIGHALVFHDGHDGFTPFYEVSEVRDPVVKAYYGSYPSLDESHHLRESIDPTSRRGAFGGHKSLELPSGRELVTKLDLLVAQATGYVLRDMSPFRELSLPDDGLAEGNVGDEYAHTMNVVGGIPAYFWTIESGELPDGLSLNSFTGTISGTPTEAGTFEFTVRVRDQTEGHVGVTRAVMLTIGN